MQRKLNTQRKPYTVKVYLTDEEVATLTRDGAETLADGVNMAAMTTAAEIDADNRMDGGEQC